MLQAVRLAPRASAQFRWQPGSSILAGSEVSLGLVLVTHSAESGLASPGPGLASSGPELASQIPREVHLPIKSQDRSLRNFIAQDLGRHRVY